MKVILKYFDKQIVSLSASIVIQYFFKQNHTTKPVLTGKIFESVAILFAPAELDFVTSSLSLLSHSCT